MASSPLPSYAFVVVSFFSVSGFAFSSAEENFSLHCPRFKCGNLTHIKYPFSNSSGCGLSIIDCVGENPMIRLGQRHYQVIDIRVSQNITLVRDQEFTKNLRDNKCNDLYNFTTLDSISLFFKPISSNITFFLCNRHSFTSYQEIFSGFQRYQGCRDHDLYFTDFKSTHSSAPATSPAPELAPVPALTPSPAPAPAPATAPQVIPHDCKLVQFPVLEQLPPFNGTWPLDNLLSLFTLGFFLQWSLPPECNKCESGTFCLRNPSGKFICEDPRKGKKSKVGLIAGISGAVGAIILICLLFFMYRCRKQIIRETKGKILTPSTLLFEKGSYFGVPIFTYEELEEATDNFNPSNELGDGGFGTVYLGKLRDGRVVAVKRLYENSFKRLQQFMNEVEILTRLRHQNLVTLYGCTSRHSRELLLVYEFIPNGTVADHLHGNRAKAGLLTWPVRMNIAIQTADALAYLHSSDIIHRDVKTNNILLDNNFRVKVADFGLSRLFPTDVTHISTAPQGTPGYVDPEYYQCYRITNKSDVYSFGVVLIELISSKQAVDVNRHQREINLGNLAINKIQNHALHELVDPCLGFESDYAVRRMTTLVAELAFRCLQQEREMRPSMDEVLEVLRGIDQEEDYNVEKAEEVDIPVDDVRLLKSTPSPRLPDSTSDKWVSSSTTPKISTI